MTAKASAGKPADDELLITRVFDAPLALVWRMWEDREHMIRWWGPEGFTCTSLDVDFRPGGTWRVGMVSDVYGEIWSGEDSAISRRANVSSSPSLGRRARANPTRPRSP